MRTGERASRTGVAPSEAATTIEPVADDPLYDPVYLAFIYGTWAVSSWLLSPTAGLVVLVVATAGLTAAASLHGRDREPRRFMTDFATILLFCAAAIALGVLGVRALSLWSNGVIGVAFAAIAAAAAAIVDAR